MAAAVPPAATEAAPASNTRRVAGRCNNGLRGSGSLLNQRTFPRADWRRCVSSRLRKHRGVGIKSATAALCEATDWCEAIPIDFAEDEHLRTNPAGERQVGGTRIAGATGLGDHQP